MLARRSRKFKRPCVDCFIISYLFCACMSSSFNTGPRGRLQEEPARARGTGRARKGRYNGNDLYLARRRQLHTERWRPGRNVRTRMYSCIQSRSITLPLICELLG